MRQRTLGFLGGALLVGGIVLGAVSGIVANRNETRPAAATMAPPGSEVPEAPVPGGWRPGPLLGGPDRSEQPPNPGPTSP